MRNLDGPEVQRVFEQLSALGWLEEAPRLRASAPRWNVNHLCHRLFAERAEEERARRQFSRESLAGIFVAAAGG